MGSPGDKFAGLCVSLFIGALALNWAVRLIDQVWGELAIGLGVVALIVTAVLIYRWRRDRW